MIGLAVIIDLPGVGPLIQVRGEVYWQRLRPPTTPALRRSVLAGHQPPILSLIGHWIYPTTGNIYFKAISFTNPPQNEIEKHIRIRKIKSYFFKWFGRRH
jgi:hypothetical protein